MAHAEKCPVCEGTGDVGAAKCHGCRGKGWVEVSGQDELLDSISKAITLINGLKDAAGRETPPPAVRGRSPHPDTYQPEYPTDPVWCDEHGWTIYSMDPGTPWRCFDRITSPATS